MRRRNRWAAVALAFLLVLAFQGIQTPFAQAADSTGIQTYAEGSVNLTWTPGAGEVAWDLSRSDDGITYVPLHDFHLKTPAFTDRTAQAGHTYDYQIVSYDANDKELKTYPTFEAKIVAEDTGTASGDAAGSPANGSPSSKIVLQLNSSQAVVNGSPKKLSIPPAAVNGVTLVPLRFIGEALGAQVNWNEADQSIGFTLGSNRVQLRIGENTAQVNGKPVPLQLAPSVTNGTTLVPLRFVSENLQMNVQFDDRINRITITPKSTASGSLNPSPAPASKPAGQNPAPAPASTIADSATGSGSETGPAPDAQSGVQNGNGSTTFSNGDQYTGSFKNGLPDGQGTYTQGNGDQYAGSFSQGLPNGQLTATLKDGTVFKGQVQLKDGKLLGTGIVQYPSGASYSGGFVNGRPDGMGALSGSGGSGYLLDFSNGTPVGEYQVNDFNHPSSSSGGSQSGNGGSSGDIPMYQSTEIPVYHSTEIQPYQATILDEYQASDIPQYKARMIDQFHAAEVPQGDPSVTPDAYQATIIKANPPNAFPTDLGNLSGAPGSDSGSGGNLMNPLAQIWEAHMMALPYLINNGMTYGD